MEKEKPDQLHETEDVNIDDEEDDDQHLQPPAAKTIKLEEVS